MKIEYFGHSCFMITTESGLRILTDPYSGVGYELPQGLQADIVTVSHEHFDHNATDKLSGAFRIVSSLGETVYNGVLFTGVDSDHDERGGALRGKNRVYKIEADGVVLCHLGDLGEPCNASLVSAIGRVDILFVPIGGRYTVDATGAWEYIRAIRPRVIIPMHYRTEDCSLDIATASLFLQNTPYTVVDKDYTFTRADLAENQVVMMKKQVSL